MTARPTPTILKKYLHKIDLLATLDTSTLTILAKQTLWQTFDSGETIFWENDTAVGLYGIHEGWIKVIKIAPSGREQVVKFLGPGETFNEIGAFTQQPNPATAVALEPVALWIVPRAALLTLLEERPSFAQYLIEKLAERVLHLVDLVSDLSLRTVRSRLARLLLETDDNALHRPRWFTQAELAARLGTVPDVIQRALRSLEKAGVIEVERHRITIIDRPTLTNIAAE